MENPTPSGNAPGALRQTVVYRRYLQLQSITRDQFSGTLAGHIVVSPAFDLEASELAIATTIAGGVFLGIEPDQQRLKSAVRNGSCDFMVNTLDEALRVLKNELRKRTPLSTGLLGDPEEILPAMVARGVQPGLIASTAPHAPVIPFVTRGAQLLPPLESASDHDQMIWTAANPQDMHRMDQLALASIPADDIDRHRWLQHAPACFYRQIPLRRVLDLNPQERTILLDSVLAAGPFQAPVTVEWLSLDGSIQSLSR
jgi:urocanate hydratase